MAIPLIRVVTSGVGKWLAAITSSAGSSNANAIPCLDANGKLDNSFLYIQRIYKTADESRTSNATPSADATFTFNGEANTDYIIEITSRFVKSSTNENVLNISFSVPSGGSGSMIGIRASNGVQGTFSQTDFTNSQGINASTNTNWNINIWAMVSIGSTPGTVAFKWAQGVSNATATTLKKGSAMFVTKLI